MKEILLTVQALCERCANCPELDIHIDRYELNDPFHSVNRNILQCRHLDRCERIFEEAEDVVKKENGIE